MVIGVLEWCDWCQVIVVHWSPHVDSDGYERTLRAYGCAPITNCRGPLKDTEGSRVVTIALCFPGTNQSLSLFSLFSLVPSFLLPLLRTAYVRLSLLELM